MKAAYGLLFGAWIAVGALAASCGNSVIGATGSTGTGGGGSTGDGCTTSPYECSGGVTGPGGFGGFVPTGSGGGCPNGYCSNGGFGCMPLDECSGGATTTVGVGGSGSGGAGPGSFCGGIAGILCSPGYYCAFTSHDCGGSDDSGVCTPEPVGCSQEPDDPVCGCDHQVYPYPCAANAAGTDVDDLGGCTPPAGMFGCGSGFCSLAAEYCLEVPSDGPNPSITFTCDSLPAACGNMPTCACLSEVTCGGDCAGTADSGFEVTCEVN